MNKQLTSIILLFVFLKLQAQVDNEIKQYTIKLDSSYLFVDNTKNCWYTFQIESDTFFRIKDNIHYYNRKAFQINSLKFNNGHLEGVKGSIKAEQYALRGHEKWELDYQKKTLKKRLKSRQELFYSKNGKPFLIWWYKTPRKIDVPLSLIETQTVKNDINPHDTPAIEFRVTHQLFMDFVVQGNIIVSISIPILENENLEIEKQKLKAIASTLNVYGSYIDFNVLSQKIKSKEQLILKDNLELIEIKVPDCMTITRSQRRNCYSASFPEKENIINTVDIYWEYKSDSVDFDDFIKKSQKYRVRENMNTIFSDMKIRRVIYTDSYLNLYCQDVYINGENIYCFINFIATPTTYEYNLWMFNELVNNILLH